MSVYTHHQFSLNFISTFIADYLLCPPETQTNGNLPIISFLLLLSPLTETVGEEDKCKLNSLIVQKVLQCTHCYVK